MYLSYNVQGNKYKKIKQKSVCDFILIQIFTPGVLELYSSERKIIQYSKTQVP